MANNKKTAFYLRLSESDGDKGIMGKNESNSIENQRHLLQSFTDAREDICGDITEYIDDGYSGTDFNRPAFTRMIEDAKRGRVGTIIVKDLSRLGRDYITTGDYIEQIFPLIGVRFIAVNNNYDSDKYSTGTAGFDVAINNLINTMYSRDLSRKMKSANETRWKNGIITSGSAPFGYKKSELSRGKWEIDPDAARTVRIIFEKAGNGLSTGEIAEYLNDEGFPTPWVYNQTHKLWKFGDLRTKDSERLWDSAKIVIILKRYEYTGALVMGRRRNLTVGGKNLRVQSDENRTVVDGVNEAIVTKEEFDRARSVLNPKRKPDFKTEQLYLLKGKVRCGNCRLCLRYDGSGFEETFVCGHTRSVGKHSECCKDSYSMKQIERQIYYSLSSVFAMLMDSGVKYENAAYRDAVTAEREIGLLEEKSLRLKEDKIRIYEAYAGERITRNEYTMEKSRIDSELGILERMILQMHSNRDNAAQRCLVLSDMIKAAKIFSTAERLTREMVDSFIDVIYVYDPRNIEIVFKNGDLLREIEEKCA